MYAGGGLLGDALHLGGNLVPALVVLCEHLLELAVERLDFVGEDIQAIPWGRRKLAFPIQKQLEATYIQFDFKMDGSKVSELTRAMGISEDIIRQLIIRKQDR
ncbi:MAG TPA: 30S ribosomal protein S6 [Chlorobaculum parvum]|uniref:Small ribosomal subunit protein bS6 n=1 Tax=Chlorobaculum parvum TaxID=274539 RepID=A0A7C5HKK9_9CHLB|nr:30S ribosomal protein S6 [Chlorobaculum parvum]